MGPRGTLGPWGPGTGPLGTLGTLGPWDTGTLGPWDRASWDPRDPGTGPLGTPGTLGPGIRYKPYTFYRIYIYIYIYIKKNIENIKKIDIFDKKFALI